MGPTRVKSVMKSGGGALSKILWRIWSQHWAWSVEWFRYVDMNLRMQVKALATFTLKFQCIIEKEST